MLLLELKIFPCCIGLYLIGYYVYSIMLALKVKFLMHTSVLFLVLISSKMIAWVVELEDSVTILAGWRNWTIQALAVTIERAFTDWRWNRFCYFFWSHICLFPFPFHASWVLPCLTRSQRWTKSLLVPLPLLLLLLWMGQPILSAAVKTCISWLQDLASCLVSNRLFSDISFYFITRTTLQAVQQSVYIHIQAFHSQNGTVVSHLYSFYVGWSKPETNHQGLLDIVFYFYFCHM